MDYLDARLAKDTVLTVTERAVVTGTLPDDEPGTKRTFVRLTLSGKSTDGQAGKPTQWFAGIGDAYSARERDPKPQQTSTILKT